MSEPRWIRFERFPGDPQRRTGIWVVVSKETGGALGEVRWYGPFRAYSFYPNSSTVYERRCLRDIADFCERQTVAHRNQRAAERSQTASPRGNP